MSAEDNTQANRKGSNLRAILDFFMGTLYIVLAGVVAYSRRFGTLELSWGLVWGMSGLLVVYGAFRIYLGYGRYKNNQ